MGPVYCTGRRLRRARRRSGALWLYVFGDNPWPSITEWVLPTTGLVVFVSIAAGCVQVAYRYDLLTS
ncbi:hypothetical protein RV134_200026 [Roseovarius sp. EC-HK134]|nr:hypothetical protein RV420_200062 [Roseovarius sp. EC-SD190]VVS99085.1 hypothetical protein RV134_200026 [Roseovarius sp. EC-HK134]